MAFTSTPSSSTPLESTVKSDTLNRVLPLYEMLLVFAEDAAGLMPSFASHTVIVPEVTGIRLAGSLGLGVRVSM